MESTSNAASSFALIRLAIHTCAISTTKSKNPASGMKMIAVALEQLSGR